METVKVTLNGISALIMNRDDLMITNPESEYRGNGSKESRLECQERVWKLKAHVNGDGNLIVPSSWIRKSLIASQRQNANPIKPAGAKKSTDTLYASFISGVLLDDAVVTNGTRPLTVMDTLPFTKMCRPSKTGGKVLVIRPMIPTPWQVVLNITITDPNIRASHIMECLKWCGRANGLGDWRPATGGVYGVYEVI